MGPMGVMFAKRDLLVRGSMASACTSLYVLPLKSGTGTAGTCAIMAMAGVCQAYTCHGMQRKSAKKSLRKYMAASGDVSCEARQGSGQHRIPFSMSVCEESSRLVRKKTRARLLQSSRFHHLCRFILGSEELDERAHALLLAAAWKPLGSC